VFNFITPLTTDDFNQDIDFIIDNFIPERMITMIYADGGNGKSWLALGLANIAASYDMQVIYLDYDNPINTLKERGVEAKLIDYYDNLFYSHRSKAIAPTVMLEALEQRAIGQAFENTLIIIDSLRNFGDMKNDLSAMRVCEKLMNIREAGATIVALHHSTKNGSNYEGSNNLRNSIDNMYRLNKAQSPEGTIKWWLEVKKERAAIQDCAFELNVNDFVMREISLDEVKLTDDERDFIEAVKSALANGTTLNKTNLLKELGYEKDNILARDRLDKFDGAHWKSTKAQRSLVYELI
jgi:RecA-family ATPase